MTASGRLAESLLQASALAVLVAVPLFFNPFSVRIFEPEKAALVRALAVLAIAAGIVRLLAATRRAPGGAAWLVPAASLAGWWPLALAIGGFLLATLLATAASVAPRASLAGSYVRAQGTVTTGAYVCVFAALVTTLRQRGARERVVLAMILTSVPVALYALLQSFGIDPQQWEARAAARATATQGNPIFLGSYLTMVLPLTLGAIAARSTLGARRGRHAFRVVAAGVAVVQVLALLACASRGPAVAALVAAVMLLALELLVRRRHRLALAVLLATLLSAAGLAALQAGRGGAAGPIGRLGSLLDPHAATSRVRILVWEGVARLVARHEPLILADGRPDRLHTLRPLVGYGPESLLMTFARFYPPELGRLEDRDRVPDRAHNGVWDALATGGVLGLAAYLGLYLAAFHLAFSSLGLVPSRRERRVLVLLVGLGSALVPLALVELAGPAFLGPGIAIGFVGGLFASLAFAAWCRIPASRDRHGDPSWIPAIAAAVLAHFVETQVGISTVTTELYFWSCLALLAGTGRSERRAAADEGRGEALVWGWLLALVLGTLAFSLVGNPSLLPTASAILRAAADDGTGLLLVTTWAVGTSVAALACGHPARALPVIAGVAVVPSMLLLGWHARALAALAVAAPDSLDAILGNAFLIERVPSRYHLFGLLVLSALGVALVRPAGGRRARAARGGALLAAAFAATAIVVAERGSFRPLRADLALKSAEYLVSRARWPEANVFFERALALAPGEAQYWSMAARGRHEEAKASGAEPARREMLMHEALAYGRVAKRLEPLLAGHLANLGRLSFWWAGVTSDPELRALRAGQADAYLERALALMPNQTRLWTERAALQTEILGGTDLARVYAERAVALDAAYEPAQRLLGVLSRQPAGAPPAAAP